MSVRKTNCLILLIILIDIIVFLLWLSQLDTKFHNGGKQEYSLGSLTQYGYIGVELTYDTEPVDVTIISPSGRKYTQEYLSIYEHDESHKKITALVDSKELGRWSVLIDKKSNKTVKYQCMTGESPTLYLTNVKLTEIDGLPYLTFLPMMSTAHAEECEYSISMSGDKRFFVLGHDTTALNEQAYVLIEPNENAYTGAKYTIRLAVQSMDKTQSAHEDIVIVLQDKSSQIQTLNEEPNYNRDKTDDTQEQKIPEDNEQNNE